MESSPRIRLLAVFLSINFLFLSVVHAQIVSCGSGFTTTLEIKNGTQAGNVNVWNDATKLYVQLTTTNCYDLCESQLAFAPTLAGIPQTKKGDPLPNKFPYQRKHCTGERGREKGVQSYTYAIDMASAKIFEGERLFFSIHASVQNRRNDGHGDHDHGDHDDHGKGDDHDHGDCNDGMKSAWAQGELFSGQEHDSYFVWTLQPYVVLPEGPVGLTVWLGANSYIDSWLSDVPDGLDVTNEKYNGWCVDMAHDIFEAQYYSSYVFSSYDPNLTGRMQSDHWDEVNYIINHKQGTNVDVQEAIWYFIGGGGPPSTQEGQAMVDDATANGEGFVPTVDESLVLIMYSGEDVQVTIIELPPGR
jgi:hypothetical protein